LLLAATMRSFAHMPLEISDRNTTRDERTVIFCDPDPIRNF